MFVQGWYLVPMYLLLLQEMEFFWCVLLLLCNFTCFSYCGIKLHRIDFALIFKFTFDTRKSVLFLFPLLHIAMWKDQIKRE